jgi:integrase
VTPPRKGRQKQRGSIDELPSGAFRVRVYAGKDPVSGRRHDLVEVIPPGPKAATLAEAARTRFLNQVDEQRNPRTSASVDQLLDRYLETLDVGRNTRRAYTGYLRKHVRPFVGHLKAGALDADALDSLYAELRRCRTHCDGRGRGIDHRTPRPHDCDDRCRSHACRPLANATIRDVHQVLHGAYKKAIRWRWVSTNPVSLAEQPPAPTPDPRPPSADEAARLVEAAWNDPDWGTLVWLTMTTGARRGELCALRWSHVDLANGTVTIRRGIAQDGADTWEKDTKTHQQRRLAIDPETVAILTEHWDRCRSRAVLLGLTLDRSAFVFSPDPDGQRHLKPSSLTQRFKRLADRLEIDAHLPSLRHYSATELIAAGVDVRTVAGRLGHSGGGITTLRVYAAWLAEADQRAAAGLLTRMPARPEARATRAERAKTDPQSPRETLAVELRDRILAGEFPIGSYLPGVKQLATTHSIAPSTAHRALSLLKDWGMIAGEPGERAKVVPRPEEQPAPNVSLPAEMQEGQGIASRWGLLDFEVRHRGELFRKFSAEADPRSGDELYDLLLGTLRRAGRDESDVAEYEMDIRDGDDLLTTFVVSRRRPSRR